MTEHTTEEELAAYKEAFNLFDEDGNGIFLSLQVCVRLVISVEIEKMPHAFN